MNDIGIEFHQLTSDEKTKDVIDFLQHSKEMIE